MPWQKLLGSNVDGLFQRFVSYKRILMGKTSEGICIAFSLEIFQNNKIHDNLKLKNSFNLVFHFC